MYLVTTGGDVREEDQIVMRTGTHYVFEDEQAAITFADSLIDAKIDTYQRSIDKMKSKKAKRGK